MEFISQQGVSEQQSGYGTRFLRQRVVSPAGGRGVNEQQATVWRDHIPAAAEGVE